MQLFSGAPWDLLLVGCFLMIQGHSQPQEAVKDNRDICLLPVDVGLCRAIIRSWYYDRNTQKCKEFDYGGCGGNANNFQSEEDCKQTCDRIKRVRPKCRLKSDKGECGASHTRYFFNLDTMMCEKFDYGGCKGNRNNFFTEFTCLLECLSEKSTDVLMGDFWKKKSRPALYNP